MSSPWLPGHMQKARRVLAEYLRLVDVVVEVLDARCPYASRNPEIERLVGDRPRFLVLNKADLAHPRTTQAWVQALRARGHLCGPADGRSGRGVDALVRAIRDELLPRPDRAPAEFLSPSGRLRRRKTRLSMMLVGIPNVGKSSLLNRLGERGRDSRGLAPVPDRADDPDQPKFGRAAHGHLRRLARTGALPGSTRGMQWLNVGKHLRLLDVPGILWPRQDDPAVLERLGFIGAIAPNSLDQEAVAVRLLQAIAAIAPAALRRYGLSRPVPPRLPTAKPPGGGAEPLLAASERDVPLELLDHVAHVKNWLLDSGRPDRLRAAAGVLADFREGGFGPISLERPEEFAGRFA